MLSSTATQVSYTGNGTAFVFNYTFRITAATDLAVVRRDLSSDDTILTLNTDYAVTGVGSEAGGTVVLPLPLAIGWVLIIARVIPLTQTTSFVSQGAFLPRTHEDALDRVVMMIQQLSSQIAAIPSGGGDPGGGGTVTFDIPVYTALIDRPPAGSMAGRLVIVSLPTQGSVLQWSALLPNGTYQWNDLSYGI